jgi:hypothetical protein
MLTKSVYDIDGLSVRAYYACKNYERIYDVKGNMTILNLAKATTSEFKRLRGCGNKTIKELSDFLKSIGLKFGMSNEELGIIPESEVRHLRREIAELAISIGLVNASAGVVLTYKECLVFAEDLIKLKNEYIETGSINTQNQNNYEQENR